MGEGGGFVSLGFRLRVLEELLLRGGGGQPQIIEDHTHRKLCTQPNTRMTYTARRAPQDAGQQPKSSQTGDPVAKVKSNLLDRLLTSFFALAILAEISAIL